MSLTPVISPILLKRLKELVVAAERDADQFARAHTRYIQAGHADIKASTALAIELYDFTLKYAAYPKLVTAKLDELKLQHKNTTSVYYHICRLAFSDVPDPDRSRMNRYARVIENAHQSNKSAAEFKEIVEHGITRALMRLSSAPGPKVDKLISQGKKVVSDSLNNKTYSVPNVKLDGVSEGQEVQLVAKYEKGKLVIYGLVPPTIATPTDVLKRIGAETEKEKNAEHDILPLLLTTIKLVTNESDSTSKASWSIGGSKATFVVEAESATAALTVKMQKPFFSENLTYSVADWVKIIKTLLPIRKHVGVQSNQKGILVTVDEFAIEDLGRWFEANRKAVMIGELEKTSLTIELQSQKSAARAVSGKTKEIGSFDAEQLKEVLEFRGQGKLFSLDLKGAHPKIVAGKKPVPNTLHFDKATFKHFKRALAKQLKWHQPVSFETLKDTVRVRATPHADIEISIELGLAS